MSRPAAGFALGFVFFVCLVALAPARLLNVFLPNDKLIMQAYSGTLWRGEAKRCLVASNSGYIHLGSIHWSLNPLSLLTLSPALTIESAWGKQRLQSELRLSGFDGVALKNLEALFSLHILRQFLPLMVAGELAIQADEIRLEGGLPVLAQGRIVWRHAAWESNQGTLPLGSYAVDFSQLPGEPLIGTVLTLAGDVVANGRVQLQERSYSVDILISAKLGLNAQLEQALLLIAQPVAEGYRVAFSGDFPAVQ